MKKKMVKWMCYSMVADVAKGEQIGRHIERWNVCEPKAAYRCRSRSPIKRQVGQAAYRSIQVQLDQSDIIIITNPPPLAASAAAVLLPSRLSVTPGGILVKICFDHPSVKHKSNKAVIAAPPMFGSDDASFAVLHAVAPVLPLPCLSLVPGLFAFGSGPLVFLFFVRLCLFHHITSRLFFYNPILSTEKSQNDGQTKRKRSSWTMDIPTTIEKEIDEFAPPNDLSLSTSG